MTALLILIAIVILTCVFLNNASSKVGVPVLLAFLLLGIIFGNNGLFPIKFEDYEFAEQTCTVALIFIMFYGGFGTRWSSAKGVFSESMLLANVGVILTAGFTGLFCHFVLGWDWVESFLMGSVVSSTDAASVFSILRSRKLGLRNNTAPLLELESGSNDPCSYMLTAIMLSMLGGSVSAGHVIWMLFAQLVFGAAFGLLIAMAAVFLIRRISFATKGFDSIFVVAVALFSYAVPTLVGGNGFLSAYIVGLVLGNQQFKGKRDLVHFFDGITSLMQVFIFFILGLMARPSLFGKCILPAIAIFLAMTLISRPATVAILLTPYRKYGFRQQALISFAGLRGAASIVFAVMVVMNEIQPQHDILNVVFCIVLLSISIQGTLIPFAAGKLGMIDDKADVMKTFNDFSDEMDLQFSKIPITADSSWKDRKVKDLGIPKNVLICIVIKADGSKTVPNGETLLDEGDTVIICSKAFHSEKTMNIIEHPLSVNSKWIGHHIYEYPNKKEDQIVLIKRKDETFIPHGSTVLEAGDILYINQREV